MTVIQFIEKHKFGILGTIALHIIIFIWLNINIIEYGVYQPKEKVVAVLDFSTLEEEQTEELQEPTLDENGNPVSSPLTNVAADASQEKTTYTNESNYSFNKNQTDQAVWDELKAMEANEFNSIQTQKANNQNIQKSQENNVAEIDPNLVKEDAAKNEKASYGANVNATASYFLKDRKFLRKSIPAYKCLTQGTVRITIKVNQKGEVISRTIDESHTNTQDECLRTEALNYAAKWKFTQDFNDLLRKEGWIEFIYEAQ